VALEDAEVDTSERFACSCEVSRHLKRQ